MHPTPRHQAPGWPEPAEITGHRVIHVPCVPCAMSIVALSIAKHQIPWALGGPWAFLFRKVLSTSWLPRPSLGVRFSTALKDSWLCSSSRTRSFSNHQDPQRRRWKDHLRTNPILQVSTNEKTSCNEEFPTKSVSFSIECRALRCLRAPPWNPERQVA